MKARHLHHRTLRIRHLHHPTLTMVIRSHLQTGCRSTGTTTMTSPARTRKKSTCERSLSRCLMHLTTQIRTCRRSRRLSYSSTKTFLKKFTGLSRTRLKTNDSDSMAPLTSSRPFTRTRAASSGGEKKRTKKRKNNNKIRIQRSKWKKSSQQCVHTCFSPIKVTLCRSRLS